VTPFVSGLFVAAAVITLMHWLRVHDRRLLPLMGLFVALAGAESLEWWHRGRLAFMVAAVACGLALASTLQGGAPGRAGPRH
jgi:hypothetical protein